MESPRPKEDLYGVVFLELPEEGKGILVAVPAVEFVPEAPAGN